LLEELQIDINVLDDGAYFSSMRQAPPRC